MADTDPVSEADLATYERTHPIPPAAFAERAERYRNAIAAELARREYLCIGPGRLIKMLPETSAGDLLRLSVMNDAQLVNYVDFGREG